MSKGKILIVDDNKNVRSFVRPALEDDGYDCIEAEDGLNAIYLIGEEEPDLIILDVHLDDPKFSGLDICKDIRSRDIQTPVIFLTVEDRIADEGRLMDRIFNLGGDDFITKREDILQANNTINPGSIEVITRKSDVKELLSRIANQLRTPRTSNGDSIANWFGDDLFIDLDSGDVRVNRKGQWLENQLTGTELKILTILVGNKGIVSKREVIRDSLGDEGLNNHGLDNYIFKIRHKIEPDPSNPTIIKTRSGRGYLFQPPGTGI